MNILIFGNIGSYAADLGKVIVDSGYTEARRCFSLDDLRQKYSDGSHAGEYYVWSLLLRAAQNESRGVFIVYGCEEQLQTLRRVVNHSKEQERKWLIVQCQATLEQIGNAITSETEVPFPHKTEMSITQKLYLAERINLRTRIMGGADFWKTATLTVNIHRTSVEACAELVLDYVKRNQPEKTAVEKAITSNFAVVPDRKYVYQSENLPSQGASRTDYE